jgi:ParB-like chromosome segregation protein Spo0J
MRAGELIPNPNNFRMHPLEQRKALAASYEEIGFARSLLGYRRPDDGRIQLIDGHLRAGFDPDMEVTVELLDVSDEEANKLLLTLDPMACLAQTDHEVHDRLRELAATNSAALNALWQATAQDFRTLRELEEPEEAVAEPDKCIIIVECLDEKEQVRLLRQLRSMGVTCKAVGS